MKTEDELIVFTHCDLDALGSMLNIEFKFPGIKKKYFHTNYSNIPQIVDEITQHVQQHGNKHIIIPDVSFATDKPSLTVLYNLFKDRGSITHIDHHLYPDGFWDEYPKMKVHYSKTKCATLLCNEYFNNTCKNERLDNLTKIIDVYDLWQYKSPLFHLSQDLNNYFWQVGIEWLLNEILNRDYKLPANYSTVCTTFNQNAKAAIEKYESKKLIMRSGDITVCFVDEYFNQILLKELDSGKNIVIGVGSWGIIKIRLHQECPYTEEQINKVRLDVTGETETGHLHAFTYKMQSKPTYENFLREIERITSSFALYCA